MPLYFLATFLICTKEKWQLMLSDSEICSWNSTMRLHMVNSKHSGYLQLSVHMARASSGLAPLFVLHCQSSYRLPWKTLPTTDMGGRLESSSFRYALEVVLFSSLFWVIYRVETGSVFIATADLPCIYKKQINSKELCWKLPNCYFLLQGIFLFVSFLSLLFDI